MKINYFKLFILLLLPLSVFSQEKTRKFKKVLGMPILFEEPLGYNDLGDQESYINKRGKRLKSPWIVFSDRENNSVYDKPNGTKLNFKLGFKDMFNVVDEKNGWIHLIKVSKKQRKLKLNNDRVDIFDYGWVEKSKMILWTRGLLDPRTRIHQKAFLLNQASGLKKLLKGKKEFVKIYTGPDNSITIGEKNIYEFYFIYKKDKHRVLLGKESKFSTITIDNVLVGWLDNGRIEEWNTRVALEPNFKEEAFNERKNNPNLRLVGYNGDFGANFHAKQGRVYDSQKFWDNDPILIPRSQLDKETGRRFLGTVIRFPLFSKTGNIIRTGVIGNINAGTLQGQMDTISEIDYSSIQKDIEKMKISSRKTNVLFVIEGREELEDIKFSILETINKMMDEENGNNYSFSIAIYRDSYEEDKNNMFINLPFTSSQSKIEEFLNSQIFGSAYDNEDYTVIYYNLKQAILQAGFNKENTNIALVVGMGGDFSSSFKRRIAAKKTNDIYLIKSNEVTSLLTAFNINLSFFQPINGGTEPYRKFIEQAQNLILETSKEQYGIYRNIENFLPDWNVPNPEFNTDITNNKEIKINGGSNYNYIIWPLINNKYTQSQATNIIIELMNNIQLESNKFYTELSDVFINGKSYKNSAGSLSPPMAKFLNQQCNLSNETIQKLLLEKYQLYTEIFLPDKIKGAKYQTTSFVLFMPKKELEDYVDQLKTLADASDLDYDKQRIELYNTLVALLNQYTGFDWSKKQLKKVTLNDLRRKMNGLKDEGIDFEGLDNFHLTDIKDERKMSDDKIEEFGSKVLGKLKRLNNILSQGGKYEFSRTSTSKENVYFWIPLEYTL